MLAFPNELHLLRFLGKKISLDNIDLMIQVNNFLRHAY